MYAHSSTATLRYTPEPYRNLIPYDLFAHEDGNFRDNVIIVPKGSPLDWDLWAPIPALDGAMQKNLYGSELVIDKSWARLLGQEMEVVV